VCFKASSLGDVDTFMKEPIPVAVEVRDLDEAEAYEFLNTEVSLLRGEVKGYHYGRKALAINFSPPDTFLKFWINMSADHTISHAFPEGTIVKVNFELNEEMAAPSTLLFDKEANRKFMGGFIVRDVANTLPIVATSPIRIGLLNPDGNPSDLLNSAWIADHYTISQRLPGLDEVVDRQIEELLLLKDSLQSARAAATLQGEELQQIDIEIAEATQRLLSIEKGEKSVFILAVFSSVIFWIQLLERYYNAPSQPKHVITKVNLCFRVDLMTTPENLYQVNDLSELLRTHRNPSHCTGAWLIRNALPTVRFDELTNILARGEPTRFAGLTFTGQVGEGGFPTPSLLMDGDSEGSLMPPAVLMAAEGLKITYAVSDEAVIHRFASTIKDTGVRILWNKRLTSELAEMFLVGFDAEHKGILVPLVKHKSIAIMQSAVYYDTTSKSTTFTAFVNRPYNFSIALFRNLFSHGSMAWVGPYALRIHPALLEGNTGEPLALSGIMDHMRVMERKARSKGSTQKLVLALFGSDGLLLFIDFQQPTVVSPQAWLTALSEIYNPNPIKAGWFAIGLTPELAHDITLEFLIGLGAPMEVALRGVWFRNADGAFVIQLNGTHFQGKANASYTWNGVTATLVTRGQHATIFGDVFPRNTRGSGSMRLAVKNLVSSARGPSLSADKDDRLSAASIATRDARHRAPSTRDRDFISLVGLGDYTSTRRAIVLQLGAERSAAPPG